MEDTNPNISKLLTTFCKSSVVLQFFGYFNTCERTMKLLCKTTYKLWCDNLKAYTNALSINKKCLTYNNPFDEEIAKFLLDDKKYGEYALNVSVSTPESFQALLGFLDGNFISLILI